MFWFSYGLMNRSIDKWFSQPVEEVRADTAAMSALLYDYAGQNAASEAQSIAQTEEFQRALASGNSSAAHRGTSGTHSDAAGRIRCGSGERQRGSQPESAGALADMKDRFPLQSACAESTRISSGARPTTLSAAAPLQGGAVLVAMPLPPKFAETARQIQESQQRYIELAAKRKLFRRTYIGFLLLLTVVVLFASTWLALLLSKLVNRPVAALAAGTEAISKGNWITASIFAPPTNWPNWCSRSTAWRSNSNPAGARSKPPAATGRGERGARKQTPVH
jgi:two-component system, NtrC family, nitrogen regulation sensor histidine kinase NtrY